MSNQEDFYKKLKFRLEETTIFPTKYMYKFIIPKDEEKENAIKDVFDHLGAVIESKPSKTGKYISLTVLVHLASADEVIVKYKEVGKVEGVISL
ncbi:DUF493 domain-containing protein [Flavobacteriaceae bacterium F08102]|nr:DUF493 domain-containing protein [Flavobacteriaceae bacterium F08102]